MKRKITLFIVISLVTILAQAQNATFSWSLCGGGATGADRSADVVTDANGNIFTANYFLNSATFNGVTLTGSPKGSGANFDASLFLSKISPTKTTLWTIYSNVGVVTPVALATTATGDLYLTATIRAVVNTADQTTTANIIDAVGTTTTFSGLSPSIVQSFVAKFNTSGVIQWVKEINSTSKTTAITSSALAADADGNVYVSGSYITNIIFPGNVTNFTTTNTTKASFITKLNGATGNEVWSKLSSGGIVSEDITSLTYGDDGNLYAAGTYRNAASPVLVTIGNKSFTPSSGYDLTLIKLNVDGDIDYIQNRSNLSDTRVKDIVVKNGKAFIAGSFRGDNGGIVIPNGTALTSTAGFLNGFTLAFNAADGTDLWQKKVYSPGITDTDGIIVGNDGRLYAFGGYANKSGTITAANVDFGNSKTIANTETSNTLADLFLVSYDVTDGTTLELHSVATSSTFETANSLTRYGNNLYLLGSTNGSPVTFENKTDYSTLGAYDFLLMNYVLPFTTSNINLTEASTQFPIIYTDKTNNQLVLKNAGKVTNARLLDLTGRSIKVLTNRNDIINISTQDIAAGVYVLQLTTLDRKITARRLIIQ